VSTVDIDVPALLAELRRLRAERGGLDRELAYYKRQYERALQVRDTAIVATKEYYDNILYVLGSDDWYRPDADTVADPDG